MITRPSDGFPPDASRSVVQAVSSGGNLRPRHILMISFGGIIGAGLFVGSSVLIRSAGPAALLSYGFCGLTVFLVMRMLAELALSAASPRIFTECTRDPLGNCVAFTAGWLYAYYWVIVIAIETVAAAATLRLWLPLPIWLIAIVLLGCVTIINLSAVRLYGEVEFWLASIKVAAIILFVALGLGYIALGHFTFAVGPALLFHNGGFAPHGYGAVIRDIPAAMFAVSGAEIAAVAAVDSSDPAGNTSRSIRSVILRVMTFYLSAILVILMMVPWSSIVSGYSPFVAALDRVGFKWGAQIMNGVVFTAVVSCLNSGIYVAARTLRGLAECGDAPSLMLRLDIRGTPYVAVLVVALAGYGLTLFSALSYQTLFGILLSASGAVMMFIYLLIALSQVINRRRQDRVGLPLPSVKMWLFPWLSWLVIMTLIGVLSLMLLNPQTAFELSASSGAAIVLLVAYVLRKRFSRLGRA